MSPLPLRFAPALPGLALALATLVAPRAARADETNMLGVRSGEVVALPTHGFVELSKEGAVELWYRHQTDQLARKAFTDKEFVDEAYSVTRRCGSSRARTARAPRRSSAANGTRSTHCCTARR